MVNAAPPAGCNGSSCTGFTGSFTNYVNGTGGTDANAPLGISIGGGAYFLVPFFSSNPAYYTKAGTTTSQQNFGGQGDVGGTGYINIALTPEWSVKARFWQINTNSSESGSVGGTTVYDAGGNSTGLASSAGSTASASSNLNINFYNFDLSRKWLFGAGSWVELSGGFAYVHMTQSYTLNVTDPVAGGSFYNASHNFNGFGPTVAFEGHYKIPCSDFGLYGSARATLLFGSSDQNYYSSTPVGSAAGSSSATAILPVGELELGGEWAHRFGRFTLSAQLGVVGQLWLNGGAAGEGANLSGVNLGGQMSSPANFGFIGGVARAGISF
jgi:hypothetical protein